MIETMEFRNKKELINWLYSDMQDFYHLIESLEIAVVKEEHLGKTLIDVALDNHRGVKENSDGTYTFTY